MTPQAFKNLQQPFANVVASLLGYNPAGAGASGGTPSGGGTPTPQSGGGAGVPGATPSGAGGQQYAVGNTTNGQDTTGLGMIPIGPAGGASGAAGANGAGTGTPNYTGGPVPGDPNSVLSGIPSYGGQTSAPITGNEQSLLNTLMGTTGANGAATSALNGILNGGSNIPQAGAGTVQGSNINPADVASGFNATNNPLLQAYITASQRATMDNLAQTLVNNGSRFTANGQFIQPTGSSAFDRAQALATQSAANAAGDIASNIGYNAYNLNQTLNQNTASQNAANALQALLGNQSTGLAASTSNASNTLNASEANQNAALQGEQNTIAAATAQGNLSSNEVQSLVQNLQAQALPRLIEQYGLDQGLQMFNNQVNDLMTIMQTGAGVTSPVIANESKSSSNTKPNLL